MSKTTVNRRQHPRVRVDRSMQVPVHLFPVLPFLGEAIDAHLVNISATGMAIIANLSPAKAKIAKGAKIKIHFRLPGQPLTECVATVVRNSSLDEEEHFLGLRFNKPPRSLASAIQKCVEIALQQLD